MFADQERQAFDLGRRMSKANFSLEDNPFARIHRAWPCSGSMASSR